ncbi:NADPH:quinone oxidoreductase family protein [Variovorax sp. KK3]|uniref:NADPH:quinone oxidoreductase family protein n=1 Tax=Variovorax sp. KK3 TaxID=1855728 RepID=UPI0009F879AA|nr:NADPH:quinone oxidoreductase family protein [Variovorax sp. KK3]
MNMKTSTMKAWVIDQPGRIDALQCLDVPRPVPGPGELLVKVSAAALNFSDLLMVEGRYQVRPPPPFAAGQEIAGRVVQAPAGSTLQPGDRICSKVEWGGFADYALVRETMAIRVPDTLDDAAAATLPVVWPTAWIALHDRAHLQPGETVLVHAAAGGLGLACLQLVRAAGARSIALVGSRKKFDAARAAGADEVVSMEDAWSDIVREHGGADVVVDSVGGDATLQSLRCIARNGRLLLVGFSGGQIPQIPANKLLLKNLSALGVYWSHDWSLPQVERSVAALLDLHARASIRVAPGRTYPFGELPLALRDLAGRGTTGKSVLLASGDAS